MIVSIDPGSAGAIAELTDEGEIIDIRDMPMRKIPKTKTSKARNVVRSQALRAVLDNEIVGSKYPGEQVRAVIVERAWPRPGELGPQAFRLGQNHGGVLACAEMMLGADLVHEIAPQRWKRHLGIQSDDSVLKDERKRDQELQAQAMAISRWPAHAHRFKAISMSGRFEAPLIGLAWLELGGQLADWSAVATVSA